MKAALALGMEHCCLGDRLLLEMNIAVALQSRALEDGEEVAMAKAVLHCWCHRHRRLPDLMYICILSVCGGVKVLQSPRRVSLKASKRYKATWGVGVASDRIHRFGKAESRGKFLNREKLRRETPGTIWSVTNDHIIVIIHHAKPQASKSSQPTVQIQKTQACSDNSNTTSRLIAPRACTRRTQPSLAPKRTVIPSSPIHCWHPSGRHH